MATVPAELRHAKRIRQPKKPSQGLCCRKVYPQLIWTTHLVYALDSSNDGVELEGIFTFHGRVLCLNFSVKEGNLAGDV